MTARDDYPYLAEHASCDSRMEHQAGGSEYTRALNEIDRLRADTLRYANVIASAEGVIAMHLPKWQSRSHIDALKRAGWWEDWIQGLHDPVFDD